MYNSYIYEIISLRTFNAHKPFVLSQTDVLRSYERYSMLSGSFPSHCLHNTEYSKHFTDTCDLTPHVLRLRGDMLV